MCPPPSGVSGPVVRWRSSPEGTGAGADRHRRADDRHDLLGRSVVREPRAHSDFANRLGRGRTACATDSVLDLQIAPGVVTARVSGLISIA